MKKRSTHECLVKQNKHSNQGGDPTQGDVISNQSTQLNEGNSSTQLPKGKSEHTWGEPYPRRKVITKQSPPKGKSEHTCGEPLPKVRLFQIKTHDYPREIQSKHTWGDPTHWRHFKSEHTGLEILQVQAFSFRDNYLCRCAYCRFKRMTVACP